MTVTVRRFEHAPIKACAVLLPEIPSCNKLSGYWPERLTPSKVVILRPKPVRIIAHAGRLRVRIAMALRIGGERLGSRVAQQPMRLATSRIGNFASRSRGWPQKAAEPRTRNQPAWCARRSCTDGSIPPDSTDVKRIRAGNLGKPRSNRLQNGCASNQTNPENRHNPPKVTPVLWPIQRPKTGALRASPVGIHKAPIRCPSESKPCVFAIFETA